MFQHTCPEVSMTHRFLAVRTVQPPPPPGGGGALKRRLGVGALPKSLKPDPV